MNAQLQEVAISAILIQEADGSWSAQCLEYDITAHARTLPDLDYELQSVLASQIAISQELKQEPFSGIPPAPQIFWDMFERAKMRVESVERPFRLPRSSTFPRISPKLKIAEHQPQMAQA
jgi:hypothetical protein